MYGIHLRLEILKYWEKDLILATGLAYRICYLVNISFDEMHHWFLANMSYLLRS